MDYEPWQKWQDTTDLERRAIASLQNAKRIILENISNQEIVSIYAKGSFVRREMNDKSDVDTLTIVKHSKTLSILRELEEEYRHSFEPQIQIGGYSLWELKNNKNTKNGKNMRASPSRTAVHLNDFFLIYGNMLPEGAIKLRTSQRMLKGMVGAFNDIFLPGYKEGSFGFSEIVKQVFWLVDNEQRFLGTHPPYFWRELDASIHDLGHIIHDAYQYRQNPTKDIKKRAEFVEKLKTYLSILEGGIQ